LPEKLSEGRPQSIEAADRALVRKPQIGDSRPAPKSTSETANGDEGGASTPAKKRRRRGGRGRTGGGAARPSNAPVKAVLVDETPLELDDDVLEQRRGRERKGRPLGRYLMAVQVQRDQGSSFEGRVTQIAVLEGRALLEHYVSRPADDVSQIHGNIYLGRVQNVLPGMEAAFVDISTPKNAVLYRGDVQYDPEDIEERTGNPRIEQLLRAKQTIVCQVTKNPIGAKGARLTQEVSLPGRFVVLIPNSSTYGISKRLSDEERKRLRSILDKVKPKQHGVIVRTAAENVTSEEIERDVLRLLKQWEQIDALAKRSQAPALLYREPDMAVRVIREEFNSEYRGVIIDDPDLYEDVRDYVASISPALADRVEYYDPATEPLPIFERFHVHEQLHKALDRKVWLPSGGSLIIEHTEALTVIDVNTGKNVGSSSLEETVYRNNLEAAVEIARQLRLRDIGGIIVIDYIDMEIRENRDDVIKVFRDALARDKTRTQVFDISELGLVEMTRKRIGEGLLESFTHLCPQCEGRGVVFDVNVLGGG
jgi:ribonuclease E